MVPLYRAGDFPPEAVAEAKAGRRVTVCLPARDEAATVGPIVEAIIRSLMGRHAVVDELLVVDDHSTDATAAVAEAAGARVVAAPGEAPGKGQAMWRGVAAAGGDVVAFCDADVTGWDPRLVLGLVGPLLVDDRLAMVKGCYERPLHGVDGEGGRVTELAARPAIALLHPQLAGIVQPLAGECAARRDVLEAIPFVGGYGVELGMLIDVAARCGPEAIGQCDLGRRVHRHRPLAELSAQAVAVLQVALARAGQTEGVGLPWTTVLQQPTAGPVTVTTEELPPLADRRALEA